MEKQYIINKITLRGTITATRLATRNRIIYTVATDGDKGDSVFPEVIHMLSGTEKAWHIGDNITAVCHARSGKRSTEGEGPLYYKQIIADRIFRTERILSTYFNDIPDAGNTPEDINEFIFCGEVNRVTVNPGGRKLVLVTLRIPEASYYNNYVEVAGFKNLAAEMKQAKVGDIMAVAGSIRTLKRSNRYIFDYVAKDVYLKKTDKDNG